MVSAPEAARALPALMRTLDIPSCVVSTLDMPVLPSAQTACAVTLQSSGSSSWWRARSDASLARRNSRFPAASSSIHLMRADSLSAPLTSRAISPRGPSR